MNAEQIKALIDTANNMSELASSMAAKCAKLEKENENLSAALSKSYEKILKARSEVHSIACKLDPIALGNKKNYGAKILEGLIRSSFFDLAGICSSLYNINMSNGKCNG